MIRMAGEGKPLRVVADQIGSPTYTVDLAETVSRIIRKPLYGAYHVTNSGECSWFDFAAAALEDYGIAGAQISRITSDEWPTPTKRPAYSVLEHRALKLGGFPEMRPWREALGDFVKSYRQVNEQA
jgi:dTDP-4-dehydrorhamnose reductase